MVPDPTTITGLIGGLPSSPGTLVGNPAAAPATGVVGDPAAVAPDPSNTEQMTGNVAPCMLPAHDGASQWTQLQQKRNTTI